MFSFFKEFTREVDTPATIIVMDEEGFEQPRRYHIVPRHVLWFFIGSTALLSLILIFFIIFTPLREFLPGYGTAEMRQNARLNALRVAALQDSLSAQQRYMIQLRQLMLGQIDSTLFAEVTTSEPGYSPAEAEDEIEDVPSSDWMDHRQPAIAVERLEATNGTPFRAASLAKGLPSLLLPAIPPVEGFITRGFDARTGHYAVDIAATEGDMVRSIGDGYVVLADWTHEGGYAIAVQHADGYVTIYKHNQRLLKRVGDRVRARDAIAISGNSGEISTGPHLHFELWHNGLAQDPRNYLIEN